MRNCWTNVKYNKTQNNLFEHKTDCLAFKLLMLTNNYLFLISNWLLFFCIPVNCKTPVTEIKLKRENIYVWIQNNWFETKMGCYTLMFRKSKLLLLRRHIKTELFDNKTQIFAMSGHVLMSLCPIASKI